MGLLQQIKNLINDSLGVATIKNDNKGIYNLLDENGNYRFTFRVNTDELHKASSHISFKEQCTVEHIETVTHQQLYNVHAVSRGGRKLLYKMERL